MAAEKTPMPIKPGHAAEGTCVGSNGSPARIATASAPIQDPVAITAPATAGATSAPLPPDRMSAVWPGLSPAIQAARMM